MTTPLRILMVEDSEADALLLLRELRQADYDLTYTRVETEEQMAEALASETWDIVVSDYVLPTFSAMAALKTFDDSGLDLPFIIVSGVVGEDAAVAAMKARAHDYILKGKLTRLVPAIERELREASHRREHKLLEEQLLLSHKMETVGRLAGGVAHDFNNLLTAILGYAHAGTKNLRPDSNIYSYFDGIQQAAQRAANLTSQLLTFSRRQVIEPKVVDLNDLIIEAAKMLRSVIGEDVELVTLLSPDLRPVKVDPEKMEQVLMNLTVNARDAMPDGGKLTIETCNTHLDADESFHHSGQISAGEYVMVTVRDDGFGMDADIKEHIFEPFYSTKETGKGTGLGLATCYGIVKQTGGYIDVESSPEGGSVFKIYLPQTQEDDLPRTAGERMDDPELHGETILLVEDEPLVRAMVARVLEDEGLTVLEAANGEEALRLAEKRSAGSIDLLLTDVVMPRMGGIELAEKFKINHPGTRVLLTSGYTDGAVIQHGALDPDTPFMQKPFLPIDLLHKVREVLED